MKQVTKAWLDRAQDDLDVAEEIIEIDHLTNMVAFHSQQAVEKIFKSIIEEFEIGFIKTHRLEMLLETVKGYINFEVDLEFIKRLDEVYIDARYPSNLGLLPYGKPSIEDAKRFCEFAKNIHSKIMNLLERETT